MCIGWCGRRNLNRRHFVNVCGSIGAEAIIFDPASLKSLLSSRPTRCHSEDANLILYHDRFLSIAESASQPSTVRMHVSTSCVFGVDQGDDPHSMTDQV